MASRDPRLFFLDSTESNYVGVQASTGASYSLNLPAAAPAGGEFLQSASGDPTSLVWGTMLEDGAAPTFHYTDYRENAYGLSGNGVAVHNAGKVTGKTLPAGTYYDMKISALVSCTSSTNTRNWALSHFGHYGPVGDRSEGFTTLSGATELNFETNNQGHETCLTWSSIVQADGNEMILRLSAKTLSAGTNTLNISYLAWSFVPVHLPDASWVAFDLNP